MADTSVAVAWDTDNRTLGFHVVGHDQTLRIESRIADANAYHASAARECFGDAVHGHVLRHAEYEWQAFNAAVTDWERQQHFDRI